MTEKPAPKPVAIDDWQVRQQQRLDRLTATYTDLIAPLTERHSIGVDSAAMVVLTCAVAVVEADQELAAIVRAVVATVDGPPKQADR